MYSILFFEQFNWTPEQASWGAWDIPSPYEDETHNGWMLPDGWQEHMTERGISYIVLDVPETEETP